MSAIFFLGYSLKLESKQKSNELPKINFFSPSSLFRCCENARSAIIYHETSQSHVFCLAWALIHYRAATIRLLSNFYTWANYLCWERLISSLLTASLRKYNYGRNTNWLWYNLATKKLVHFCN